jgi:multiple sugar transport system substrate-binding protein
MLKQSYRRVVLGASLVGSLAVALVSVGLTQNAPVELKFMFWGSGGEKAAVEASIQQFNEENPGIRVLAQHVPGDYITKVNTLIASNQEPDVAYIPENLALQLGEKGKLLELSQYYKDFPELAKRLPQTYLYFAPNKTIGSYIAPEIATLFFNRELFKEAKVAVPPAEVSKAWSWDQFVRTAQLLTLDRDGKNALDANFDDKNIKQFGFSFPSWWLGWYTFMRANGADLTDATGKKYRLNSPQGVQVFQRLQDLMWKYHVTPTPTQMQNSPNTSAQLQSKRVAMALDGQWLLLDIAAAKVNVGVGVLPKMARSLTVLTGGAASIFANTKHPKEALKFYMAFNNPTKVDLYKKGLWMPLEQKYYTDPKFTAQWVTEGVHPPEYQTAVVDYTLKHSVASPTIRFRNWVTLDPIIGAGLDPIWTNKKTAKEALDALEAKVQPLLQGLYPNK